MKVKVIVLCWVVLLGFLPLSMVSARADNAVAETALAAHLPNLKQPEKTLLTGGQPDVSAWPLLRQQGVTTVVNLRSDKEMAGSDEAAQVVAHGMKYVHIPVSGATDVSLTHAARLHDVLAAAHGKVLVHCASGNRAGALLALDAAQSRGLDVEAAIRYGKAAGLTSLEARVREVLSAPQLAKPGTQAE